MKQKRTLLLISTLLIVFSPANLSAQSVAQEIGEFRETQGPFSLPEGLILGENFKFGYVTMPEMHSNPNGRTIELAVAIFPSYSENHRADPLVMNTAGPGKSNMDNFIPQIVGLLGQFILPERDIVIIELRGLRYSKPFLMCNEVTEAQRSMMGKNLSTNETLAVISTALLESKKRFDEEDVNLSAYNNVETAADIAMIMKRLGYEKFNIVGSSAGTIVAHHVIRDYPDMVRCAILDAGLPLDPSIIIDYVPSIVDRLKIYFQECGNDQQCNEAFPDLENRFLALLSSLNRKPVTLELIDPVAGDEIEYVVNGYRLSSYLFNSMFYSTQIPYLIGKVLNGDYSDVKNYLTYRLMPNYFADGLGYTVFLTEAGEFNVSDIELDPKYRIFSEGITRSGLGGRYLKEVDKVWKITKIETSRIQYPEPKDVPVLVLNGKYDPVIPEKYDQVMKRALNNCYIYRIDGVPHSAFDNATQCAIPMMLQFLADPSRAPDSSCIENFKQAYKVSD